MAVRRFTAAVIGASVVALAAISNVAVGDASRVNPAMIEQTAPIDELSVARREAHVRPALTGPVDHVAVVGDSLYFDHSMVGTGGVNSTVDRIRTQVRSGLGDPDFRVQNLSRPGVVIAFPEEARELGFITLREHLDVVLDPDGDQPDVLVIPASTSDLNLQWRRPVGALATLLVSELRTLVADLEGRGVQVVIVPAFGINDDMYDAANSVLLEESVRLHANARARALNVAMSRSDLPVLFPQFRDLDTDFDGIVDASFFEDHNPVLGFDDGLHPNQAGHVLIAAQISQRLVPVLVAARESAR